MVGQRGATGVRTSAHTYHAWKGLRVACRNRTTTFSLQVIPSGTTRRHSSPLTCGNALTERYYDGLGTASTATELHRPAPGRARSCCRCGCSALAALHRPWVIELPEAAETRTLVRGWAEPVPPCASYGEGAGR